MTPTFEFTQEEFVKGIPVKAIKNGKADKKFVEVLVRKANGRVSRIVKCSLESEEGQKVAARIIQKIPPMGGVGTISSLANNVQTEVVRREVKKVGKDVKKVLELTRDLSANVDRIAQGMSIIQSLSFLNTALSATNLGVSAIGFMTVNRKLDTLQGEIHKILQIVGDTYKIKIIEIINSGMSLVDKTKMFNQRIKTDRFSLKEYEDLLLSYRDYLRFVHSLTIEGIIGIDIVYPVIMHLLQNYAEIMNRYVADYFYTNNEVPEINMDIIQNFVEPQFMDQFFDYVYIDCDKTKTEAEQAQLIHILLVGNAYTQIEDTKDLVLALPDKGSYLTLQEFITKEAEDRVKEYLPI